MPRNPPRLTFETNVQNGWRCKLLCDQCTSITVTGRRCRNRVCFGYPTCWVHTKKEYGVKIRPSAHGKGLFATRDFNANDMICPYIGEPLTPRCLNSRYGATTAPYAVNDQRTGLEIDSACIRGTGAMANGVFNRNGRSAAVTAHNAVLYEDQGQIYLYARTNIAAGDEITVHYGQNYRMDSQHSTTRSSRVENKPC